MNNSDKIPVGKAENLINKTFNNLTVLYRVKNQDKSRAAWWKCQCICGNTTYVRADQLKNGQTKSCGCLITKINKNKIIDMSNQKIGKLTILFPINKRSKSGEVYWHCKCECGSEVDIIGSSLRRGVFSCGCENSKGEYIISNILNKNNISFNKEYSFSTCKIIKPMRFDFYVENTYLIEFDGKQHFDYTNSCWNTDEKFKETQEHDNYKNQWCKDNNIPLIRIPYTKLDTLCIEDLLLETTQFRVV